MALCRRVLPKIASACLFSHSSFTPSFMVISFIPKRTLLGECWLQMTVYSNSRKACLSQLEKANVTREHYVSMLSEQLANEKSTMIETDLRNLLLVAEESDTQLAVAMLRRFAVQNGAAQFGPLVMRMFHFLQLPNGALAVYKDPALSHMFTYSEPLAVLLDLLYESANYNEVLNVYQTMAKRWSATTFVLAAACYRLGTAEALQILVDAINQICLRGLRLGERELCIAALLAIQHKQFHLVDFCERLSPRPEMSVNHAFLRILRALEQSSHQEIVMLLGWLCRKAKGRTRVLPSDIMARVSGLIDTLKAQQDEQSASLACQLDDACKQVRDNGLVSKWTFEKRLLSPLIWVTDNTSERSEYDLHCADNASWEATTRKPKLSTTANSSQGQSHPLTFRNRRKFEQTSSDFQIDSNWSRSSRGNSAHGSNSTNYEIAQHDVARAARVDVNTLSSMRRNTAAPSHIIKALRNADDEELSSVLEYVRGELRLRRAAEVHDATAKQLDDLVCKLKERVSSEKPATATSLARLNAVRKALVSATRLLDQSAQEREPDITKNRSS